MRTSQLKDKINQQGFSLVELGVVLAIVGILAATAVPLVTGGGGRHLKGAARNLWADVRFVRMEAVKRRTNIAIQFFDVNNGNNYVIFVDDGAGGGTAGDRSINGTELILKTAPMLKGVSIDSVNFGTGAPNVGSIGYNSRALPTGINNGNIVLVRSPPPNFHQYRLVLSQAGSFRIESSTDTGVTWSE